MAETQQPGLSWGLVVGGACPRGSPALGVHGSRPQTLRVDEALLPLSHPEPLICATSIPGYASRDTRPGAPNKTRAQRLHHEK